MVSLTFAVYFLIAIVLAIDVHECCHAWMADQLGDPTARYQGRVSLNPLVHLDPLGSLMILLMAFARIGFGWGKPVPVNGSNLRHGPIVGEAMVAASGPLANVLAAGLVAVPLRFAMGRLNLPEPLVDLLLVVFIVNISLAVFNLLPIFPLDGYHVLLGILHELPFRLTRQLWIVLSSSALQMYGPMILLVALFMGRGLLSRILSPVVNAFASIFLGLPVY